jgi:hypothetical protein
MSDTYHGELARSRIARLCRFDELGAFSAYIGFLGLESAARAAMEREQQTARELAEIRWLAEACALPYDEALALLQAAWAADIAARNPCHCKRIPWRPHLHRFDL